MTFAPVDDNVIENKTEPKKKTELQKPWFNWWLSISVVSIGPLILAVSDTMMRKTREDTPYASKDVAETAAADAIADHNKNCSCGRDLGEHYLGAFEEGKSPP